METTCKNSQLQEGRPRLSGNTVMHVDIYDNFLVDFTGQGINVRRPTHDAQPSLL